MFWLLLLFALAYAQDQYLLGKPGQTCFAACAAYGLNCVGQIQTNDSTAIFYQVGINCQTGYNDDWNAQAQPAVITDPGNIHYGQCVGYIGVPNDVMCGGSNGEYSRLCRCTALRSPTDMRTFGTGISAGTIPTVQYEIFQWLVPSGAVGVMTHFWITSGDQLENCTIRYYVDGEEEASIAFQPDLGAGTGFGDPTAPWGTKWVGKGAQTSSWFHNIRIPFTKSIRVTWHATAGQPIGAYVIVRGMQNLPIKIGGIPIPASAKLKLLVNNIHMQPLQYLDIVNIPSGNGLFFFHTLAVTSGNLNFLEGCYRFYSPPNNTYPGVLLSTGTEDYYDSGWYFDAGEFRFPVAGFTHSDSNSGMTRISAYRFHEMDPIQFNNGLRFVWRNGDADDPKTGMKCFMESGGNVVGNPTTSDVTTYAWVYVW